VALCILAALLVIDFAIMLTAAAGIALLYVVLSRFSYRRLHGSSDVIAAALRQRVQSVQEGLGGIRDVLLDRSQPVFLAKFSGIDDRFRQAQASNQFLAAAPRQLVEAASVVLIAVVAVLVSGRPGGLAAALPVLGALALGAQRLLPLVQQVYFSWSQIYGHRATLIDIAALLDPQGEDFAQVAQLPAAAPLADAIRFDAVDFSYPGCDTRALADITLDIARGSRLGLIGASGSGKSTFVDLLLGLLDPDKGRLSMDGQPLGSDNVAAWQAQVAHVPQAIFLADDTIAANIAFGREAGAIDMERVREAARLAEIDSFIAGLPEGYATGVGERGVRLSGGQRQRIGIARALYKQASVLVFDEATSALDDATEGAVMASIARLPRSLTLVMIAHRLTTLRQCDRIVRLDHGRIAGIGSYEALLGSAKDAQ
jgi:ABC-type multidrug transport system fused ATPase/permease subunit